MNDFDFPVAVAPIYTGEGDKQREISRRKAIVREDTGDILSVVSSKYQILEHKHVIEGVRSALDGVDYQEKIQMGSNGRNFLVTADLPMERSIEVQKGDILSLRIMARNSYDGTSAFQLMLGAVRLVCTNGMTGFTHAFQYSQRHIGTATTIGVKAEELRSGIEQLSAQFRQMQPVFADMTKTPVRHEADELFSNGLVPSPFPQYLLDEARERFEAEPMGGTKWGYYNSLTFAITHKMKKERPFAALQYGGVAWKAAIKA